MIYLELSVECSCSPAFLPIIKGWICRARPSGSLLRAMVSVYDINNKMYLIVLLYYRHNLNAWLRLRHKVNIPFKNGHDGSSKSLSVFGVGILMIYPKATHRLASVASGPQRPVRPGLSARQCVCAHPDHFCWHSLHLPPLMSIIIQWIRPTQMPIAIISHELCFPQRHVSTHPAA